MCYILSCLLIFLLPAASGVVQAHWLFRTARKPRISPHSDVCPSVPRHSGLTPAFSLSKIGGLCHQLHHRFPSLFCCVFPSLHVSPLDVLYICLLDYSLHESIDFVLFTAISQALIQSPTCVYTIHNG